VYYAARTLGQPRTEPASPRRLAAALAAGIRPVSHDLTALTVTAAAWFLIARSISDWWGAWRQLLLDSVSATGGSVVHIAPLMRDVSAIVLMLLPVGAVIVVVTLTAWGVQGGLRFRSRAQRVSVEQSPWLRTCWLVVKALVIAMALASIVNASLRAVLASSSAELEYAVRVLRGLMDLGRSRMGTALALLVIGDVIVARLLWRRSLRMTRDELRRELRETEGDRTLRDEGRRRQHATALDT